MCTKQKRKLIDNNNVTNKNIMAEIQKFDEWMFKIRNKYYFDHERMAHAYEKIIAPTNE